jgi:alpha-ketoglutarate-dependent taurine dioxygenase
LLEPGDLQFLNNRSVLHGRTEFKDYDSLDKKRLMLRLWLAMPDWIELPDSMKSH